MGGDDEEVRWCVVASNDKGGILVRTGKETTSAEASSRLATGALVRQEELVDGRLSYKKLTGDGPETGWVSLKLKDKILVEEAPLLNMKSAEAGREAGVYADRPAVAPSSRKIRVLCLHGTASSEKVMKSQINLLTRKLDTDVEFVFQEGPIVCDEKNAIVAKQIELMKKFFPAETFKQWCEPLGEQLGWRKYDGLELAAEKIQEALKKHAPIDAMYGFSQGSNMAHIAAAQAGLGKGEPVRCVIHCCTSKPGWVGQKPELFDYKIPVPALVIKADKDTVATGSDEIADTYEVADRASHGAEHRPLPGKPPEAQEVIDAIKEFLLKHCRE